MKKWMILSSVFLVLLFVTACSNDDLSEPSNLDNTSNVNNDSEKEVVNEEKENTDLNADRADSKDNDRAESQEDMKKMMAALDFYEFELDVDYGSDKEFKVEIEHHSNGDIEAEVEDEVNGKNIQDDVEAFNYIYPHVKKLNVSKELDKEEAIDQVLKAFDLPEDYKEIEIDFKFEDGSKLEFEDKK